MTRRFVAAAALLVVFCGNLHAGEVRTLVLPFLYENEEFKAVADDLTEAAVAEVKATPGLYYVTSEEYMETVFAGKDADFFGTDMKKVFQMRMLFSLIEADDIGSIADFKDKWKVDMIVACGVKDKGGLYSITMQVVRLAAGRFRSEVFETKPPEAKTDIRRRLAAMLKNSEELEKVMADGVSDAKMSTVYYDVKSTEGEKIRITVNYTAKRPSPEIQGVSIIPQEPIKSGVKRLTMISRDRKPIEVTTSYIDGKIDYVRLDTARPNEAGERTETMFVETEGGYLMKFTVRFKDRSIERFLVEPEVTAYP